MFRILSLLAFGVALQGAASFALANSCVRFDAAVIPASVPQLATQPAQRLMNEIAKQTQARGMTVRGAVVIRTPTQVYVLWLQGEFACNATTYDTTEFDRFMRAVFGVNA